jgi:heat shock protein HtpX
MPAERSVVLESNIPTEAVEGLSAFFERYYIVPSWRLIEKDSYRKSSDGGVQKFSWKFAVPKEYVPFYCDLEISQASIELKFQNLDESNSAQNRLVERTEDDVQEIVSSYFQNARMSSLYFVIASEDESHCEAPNQEGKTQRSLLRRILSGNNTNVYLIFTLIGFLLLFTVGLIGLFFLLAMQLIYMYYSDRVMLNMGNVQPTANRPLVSVVSAMADQETQDFLRQFGKKILSDIRKDVSKLNLEVASREEFPKEQSILDLKASIISILSRYRIKVSADHLEIKTKNVYDIVMKAAQKFNLPVPKIVVANSVVSNAASTGISKHRSSIMITAGAIGDLSDEELESTVGHELGHIKGHDPLILYGVTSFQFVGAFYLWYPLVEHLGLFYFLIAFGVIFAVGKVLETRADTESAVVLGDPQTFATSLRKIAFRELYREKYSPIARLLDWFRFDPHPPTYFRISRMSEFIGKDLSRFRHAFMISLRDTLVGFLSAFV